MSLSLSSVEGGGRGGGASAFGTHFGLISFISMDYNIFVKQKPFTLR